MTQEKTPRQLRAYAVKHYRAMSRYYQSRGMLQCAAESRETARRIAALPITSRLVTGESVFED